MIAQEENERQGMFFSGKQAEWRCFEEKFLARARKMGFEELLTGIIMVEPGVDFWN